MRPNSLSVGLTHKFSYMVPPSRTVPDLFPESREFAQMPRVLATGYLVGLVEWACMQLANPYLDLPFEQTVGTHIDISHEAPTPPGLEIVCRVELTEVDGRRLVFHIEVEDGVDVVARGTHERYVINAGPFETRAFAKRNR